MVVAEGFLEARRGAGSFVASGLAESLPLISADPGDGAQAVGGHGSRRSRRGKGLAARADSPTPDTSPFSPNQPAYLAAMVLLDPGDTVWKEDPGYVTMRELIRAYGARVAAVPVDQDGLDVESGIARAPAANWATASNL